ncbi:MAG TPA: hypothetical protein VNV35_16895 [Puia sp.]|jgi:hypothetical protein|nr:hypothetical protein [Puia sp.]
MGNIEFSKIGRAILENKELSDYISVRLANVTPEEDAAGKILIELTNGKTLVLRFGPGNMPTIKNAAIQQEAELV